MRSRTRGLEVPGHRPLLTLPAPRQRGAGKWGSGTHVGPGPPSWPHSTSPTGLGRGIKPCHWGRSAGSSQAPKMLRPLPPARGKLCPEEVGLGPRLCQGLGTALPGRAGELPGQPVASQAPGPFLQAEGPGSLSHSPLCRRHLPWRSRQEAALCSLGRSLSPGLSAPSNPFWLVRASPGAGPTLCPHTPQPPSPSSLSLSFPTSFLS